MRTQWKRWNWGLQQSPGRKSRLSQDHKLLLAASTWLDWPLRVSWPPAAGTAVWAALQGTKRCFHCVLIGRPSCRKQQPQQHGLRRVNQTKAQNRSTQWESETYFSCVISQCGQRKWCVFSVVECGQRIWPPGEQQPAASDLQIPVGFTAHESAWRVGCVFSYWSATLLLSYSKGFASPRLELLHNIDPLYYDIAPCKFTFLFSTLTLLEIFFSVCLKIFSVNSNCWFHRMSIVKVNYAFP